MSPYAAVALLFAYLLQKTLDDDGWRQQRDRMTDVDRLSVHVCLSIETRASRAADSRHTKDCVTMICQSSVSCLSRLT